MKRINLRFEMAEELEDIEVLIRASERDSEVLSLIERIAGKPPDARSRPRRRTGLREK